MGVAVYYVGGTLFLFIFVLLYQSVVPQVQHEKPRKRPRSKLVPPGDAAGVPHRAVSADTPEIGYRRSPTAPISAAAADAIPRPVPLGVTNLPLRHGVPLFGWAGPCVP